MFRKEFYFFLLLSVILEKQESTISKSLKLTGGTLRNQKTVSLMKTSLTK